MKSLLIEDTTVDERMQIVKEALGGFGNCDCEGIDMDDMYDDYSSADANWLTSTATSVSSTLAL